MNWLKEAKSVWEDGEMDYFFAPISFYKNGAVKRFLDIMGNHKSGFITVFNRDELVLAILFYDQFSAEQMSYKLCKSGEWIALS